MFTFSERFTRIFLLSINAVFVVLGISMLVSGIYKKVSKSAPKEMDDDIFDNQSDGTSAILAGCLDIIIGTCGMVGAFLRKRLLLWINVGLLAASIIGNLTILIMYSIGTSRVTAEATENVKNAIVDHYGNNSNADSRELTVSIDEHQKSDGCCGWSGIDGENLFLKSPWYKQINLNVTALPRTLPDSCCITAGDDCRATTDLKEARKQGYVNKFDCIDRIVGRVKTFMILTILQLLFVTITQMACVAFSLLHLLQESPGA